MTDEKMLRNTMGAELMALMDDPEVIEFWLNPDGKIFSETLGVGKRLTSIKLTQAEAMNIIVTIAGTDGKIVNEKEPIVDATIRYNGGRFAASIPPVSAPSFNIRKPASRVYSMDELVEQGNLDKEAAEIIKQGVKDKKNFLVAGSTGSGKTTFCNALLQLISEQNDRIIMMEDIPELQCPAEDTLKLSSTPTVSVQKLVKATLRRRGDRPIIGELRGGEAYDLLKLWNTGHPGGFATLHADSASDALSRLEDLALEAVDHIKPRMIVRSVHYIVFMQKEGGKRKVTSLVEVVRHDGTDYVTNELINPH